jgi:hypothetical protein
MPTLAAPKNQSFQWMSRVGINAADVNWLEVMNGSPELHLPGNRDRVAHIYQSAFGALLASPRPAQRIIELLE